MLSPAVKAFSLTIEDQTYPMPFILFVRSVVQGVGKDKDGNFRKIHAIKIIRDHFNFLSVDLGGIGLRECKVLVEYVYANLDFLEAISTAIVTEAWKREQAQKQSESFQRL
jgi:hypothetical protein